MWLLIMMANGPSAVETADGKDPWPDSAKLYQPYEVDQILLPDFARCLSVKTYLKMCNLKFQTELRTNAEFMSPSGQVPFIKVGPTLISDLDPIISFISAKGLNIATEHSETQKPEMKAFMALVENVLIKAELYLSWCDHEISANVTKPRYGSPYPWPLNYLLPLKKQYQVRQLLKASGWADKTYDEVCEEVKSCCQALSEKLGDQPYFFGVRPTEVDALVYGHLYALVTTTLPKNHVAEMVDSFENLADFCRRIDKAYFEETELFRQV